MAQALAHSNTRDFWKEVSKVKGTSKGLPNNVDDKMGKRDIAQLFMQKYEKLYNSSHTYSFDKMSKIIERLNIDIEYKCHANACYHSHTVIPGEIKKAVKRLKHGKHDGDNGHYSDHLINGTSRLYTYMSLLFTSMLVHGFSPEGFHISTVIPIPKNKRKSLNDSDNYRAIALGSIMGKVFDIALLESNTTIFETTDLQFGFKRNHSTTLCTSVVKETIRYYLNRGSNVYAMLLDASKAFDKVEYIKLFNLLIEKGLCPLVARFMAVLYTNQTIRVKWGDFLSHEFKVSNGVKQGGVMFPILFGIYYDELLCKLKDSGCGCKIGNVFAGAFAYADDASLLCPSKQGLNKMLDITNELFF
jgi:hypothetical protein